MSASALTVSGVRFNNRNLGHNSFPRDGYQLYVMSTYLNRHDGRPVASSKVCKILISISDVPACRRSMREYPGAGRGRLLFAWEPNLFRLESLLCDRFTVRQLLTPSEVYYHNSA